MKTIIKRKKVGPSNLYISQENKPNIKNIYKNGGHIRKKNFKLNFAEDEYKSPTSFLEILLNSMQTINPSINNDSPNINLCVKIDINKTTNNKIDVINLFLKL